MAFSPGTNRSRATLNWRYLSARDDGASERWTIVWDTKRKAGKAGRNTAVEKTESDALERVRHFLLMGFIVFELRHPSGTVFLDEAGLRLRIGTIVKY